MNRRQFLEASTVLAGGAWVGKSPGIDRTVEFANQGAAVRADRTMIGIQAGAVSFVDEGTERVLDNFQETASINTIFLATFTYGRGIAGRQLQNQPLPDHGVILSRKYSEMKLGNLRGAGRAIRELKLA